jgi:divalent metal cation (Fe/Co/Zn/Cd) transporter
MSSAIDVSRGAPTTSREWQRLARSVRRLSWASLVWATIEGTVGVVAGMLAGSIALTGFGFDSALEGFASVVVVWRFSGSRTPSLGAEERAQQMIAVSFFLLAPYLAVDALRTLVVEHHAESSTIGIVLTAGTLLICPGLGMAKQRIGERLGSSATIGAGRQNLLCGALAAGVLLGLLANSVLGLWWLDPVVALGIAVACIREGRRTWRGEGCDCASCPVPVGEL